ncbi:15646_t:CDS:2 [Acaulospora colombiana]|uniref:15646_t:CDS:1 n=1 Tax=Acaulospora colombiana TaxID=27376 RepID=A0ACA9K7D2_9GLOM|nr:15646_t:CDS:2 [Acaulospora colombiana]
MLSPLLETFESLLQTNNLRQDDLIQIIQKIKETISNNNNDDCDHLLLSRALTLLVISYKHIWILLVLARSVDCFREMMRLKWQEIMESTELFVSGLQAVQSLSESIETELCKVANDIVDDIDGISTIIKIHVSCLHLLGDVLQILRKGTSSCGGDTFIPIEFLIKRRQGYELNALSSLCSCALKTVYCTFMITKLPAIALKFSKDCESRQLISTWCKGAHDALGDFLKFIDENLLTFKNAELELNEKLALKISDGMLV